MVKYHEFGLWFSNRFIRLPSDSRYLALSALSLKAGTKIWTGLLASIRYLVFADRNLPPLL